MISLADICSPKQWKTISSQNLTEEGFPVFGANGIIGCYSEYTHEHPTILITCRGATCGTINVSLPKSYVNGNAMALDNLNPNVDLYYLKYYLEKRGLDDVISGSAQPQITRENLKKVKIPLPPLPEQKKIAAILDAADAYRQKTKALIAKYDELTQSLFFDMFGDPGKGDYPHVEYEMEEIANKVTDGDHATPKRTDSGYKLLSCRNVKNGFIDFDAGVDYVGEKEFNRMFKRCGPVKGDILISCSGTIGRTTAVKIDEPFVLVRSAALIKPKRDMVNSIFLEKYLQTSYMQAIMTRKANASSQANLFTGPIKSLPVLLPDIAEQNLFAQRIESIELQKQKVLGTEQKTEDLFNCLLQRAFKGELT